jgi:hypothetical protein
LGFLFFHPVERNVIRVRLHLFQVRREEATQQWKQFQGSPLPPTTHNIAKKQQKLFYCRAAILKKTAANGIVIISAMKASLVET